MLRSTMLPPAHNIPLHFYVKGLIMSESIQDRIADLMPRYPNLLLGQRKAIQRCLRQLDAIDNASDNLRFTELQERYENDARELVQQLASGNCDSYTLGNFTRSRSELNATIKLRKQLGLT